MRRGFQPPADLWGSVGDFGGGDFGGPNVRSTFGKIWVRGDLMFVLGWGRVYLYCWWELGMVGKTRPYRIIPMFDCFGKIWVRGDRLLGKFGLGAIECLSLGGGGFI